MAIPTPPHDLDRAERKQFRKTAQALANAGADVAARADLICDYTRAASRVAYLREQEKTADFDQKIAAARAVNVALMEKRRLRDQLWRGVAIKRPQPSVAERAAELLRNEAREAWRDYHHGRAHRDLSEAEMEALYGDTSDIGVILCATARQEAIELAYYELCASRHGLVPSFEDFAAEAERHDPADD